MGNVKHKLTTKRSGLSYIWCARGKANSDSSLSTYNRHADCLRPLRCLEFFRKRYGHELMTLSDERRNMLLVVAVLLITITYEALPSLLGGL